MISGTLPNNTVWWISRDGKKVWIESKELEKQKFSDKGYGVVQDRIFITKMRKQVGELAGSRLNSRLYKDAWVVKLDVFLEVYPDLVAEINKKNSDEMKKKKQTKPVIKSKKVLQQDEKGKERRYEDTDEDLGQQEEQKEKVNEKIYFDATHPYIEWIKNEIDKSPNMELKILSEDMKGKMGEDYINMHDLRVYFGLKKILEDIGIVIQLGKSKGKSVLIMKKG